MKAAIFEALRRLRVSAHSFLSDTGAGGVRPAPESRRLRPYRAEPLERRLLLASISGYVLQANGAGGGIPGVTVFMDDNRNGVLDDGERSALNLTDGNGRYEFPDTPPGNYNILALAKTGYIAQTFERLIGLGSWEDSGPLTTWRSDQTTDNYASLWEIDPELGYCFNRSPIIGHDSEADQRHVNYAGLTAFPNRPGWYLAQTQDDGTAAWELIFECEAHVVAIHWEPGMAYADAYAYFDPGHDLVYGGGLDFDPSDPGVLYGGLGDDYEPANNEWYGDDWLWKRDLNDGSGSDIRDLSPPASPGDLAFDGDGNLYLFAGQLLRIDKSNGAELGRIDVPIYGWAAEWNPRKANFWWAGLGLGTIDPATAMVTTIRPSFNFGVPPGSDSRRYLFEGLELVGGFRDRPVELGTTDLTGINFKHTLDQVGISGTVFHDANNNGNRDPGENEGLPGWRVYLDNGNNRFEIEEESWVTDQYGHYSFPLLNPGSYRVCLERQPGYDTTSPKNPATNYFPDLQAGTYYTADFGVAQTVDVRGTTFDDVNLDGVQQKQTSRWIPSWVQPDAPIPESRMGLISTLQIDSPGSLIGDLNVSLDIAHPRDQDLRVELISPAGTTVRLFQHVGGTGQNFSGTGFDDEAINSITFINASDAPFTAVYRPEQSLTVFDGQPLSGTWTLRVYDDAAGMTGTLNTWRLMAEVPLPTEPALPGATVYVDQDHNGVLNTNVIQGDSTLRLWIPGQGNMLSTIGIPEIPGPIADVDVTVNIMHANVTDLVLDLVSPWGTRVRLTQWPRGGNESNFTGTVFDDHAAMSIESVWARGPFTGRWRPIEDLADFNGETPGGTWTLMITDVRSHVGGNGILNSWSLDITMGDITTTSDSTGDYEFRNLPPGPLSIHQQLTPQRSPTTPRPVAETVVEPFEFDLSQYTQREAGHGSVLSPAAAYDGAQGLIPGRWLVGNDDAPRVRRGDTVSAMVKFPQAGPFSAWLGFGAFEGGTLAVAISPGTTGSTPGKLTIQQCGEGFDVQKATRLAEVPIGSLFSTVWYRLDVEWAKSGTIVARLSLPGRDDVFQVAAVTGWPVDEGSLAFRGKLGVDRPSFYFDRISIKRDPGQRVLTPNGLTNNVNFGSAADGIIQGAVYQDANGNGAWDNEAGIPGVHIYADTNVNGIFDRYSATPMDYTNYPIDDHQTRVSELKVGGMPGVVRQVSAYVHIDHKRLGDLQAWLVSPWGTRVDLFSHVGGTNINIDCWFTDDAVTPIDNATWPIAWGDYRPKGRLFDFAGEDPNGVWRLVVSDDVANELDGQLITFAVTLSTGDLDTLTDPNGLYLGAELPAGAYLVRQEVPTGWLQTAPQPDSSLVVPLLGGQIVLGQNFADTKVGGVAGSVWQDHDFDGVRDAEDEGVGGYEVFLDGGNDGVRDVYADQTFTSNAVVGITELHTATSVLPVFGLVGQILNVTLQLNILHTRDSDLGVYLVSPQGMRVRLFERVGGTGAHFLSTVLTDRSRVYIADGVAPFTGTYRPQQPLALLNGQNPNGFWILEMTDSVEGEFGALVDWQMTLTTGDRYTSTDAGGNFSFAGVLPGNWPVRLVSRDGWFPVTPADSRRDVSILMGQQVSGVDFSVNQNDQPTDLALYNTAVAENLPAGALVGTLRTIDPDLVDTFTYGMTGRDAEAFVISGNQLNTAASFDYETRSRYNIVIRATDRGGLFVEKTFAIDVLNAVERAPVITGISTDTATPDDGITSDRTLLINGTCEPGMSIKVFRGGSHIGTTLASASGGWQYDYTGTSLADGPYVITASASDSLGNTSALSSGYQVIVDGTAPVSSHQVSGTAITLSANDGPGSGVSWIKYRIDSGNWTVYTTPFTAPASSTVSFYSADRAGSEEAVRSFVVTTPLTPLVVPSTGHVYVRLLGTDITVYANDDGTGLPIQSQPLAKTTTLTINGLAGADRVTLDFANGNFIPGGGISLDAGSGPDRLLFKGIEGYQDLDIGRLRVSVGAKSISVSGLETVQILQAGGMVLASAFELAGGMSLDLGSGGLRIKAGDADAVRVAIASARNGGTWTGTGLTSSAAAARSQTDGLTGLAMMQDDDDILVKYTWNGDANLDGLVKADDYFKIDSGFIGQRRGYVNGDFNYDGVVNAEDYFLIDSAFLGQSGRLTTASASVSTAVYTAGSLAAMPPQQAVIGRSKPATRGRISVS